MPRWTENDILSALTDVNKGFSIRSVAKHYRIPESSIRLRCSKEQSSVAVPLGRHPEFDSEIETKLAQCIRDLCQHGFSLKQQDILDLVQEYVKINNKLTCFKNGRAGIDWLNNFMKRNNLLQKRLLFFRKIEETQRKTHLLYFIGMTFWKIL